VNSPPNAASQIFNYRIERQRQITRRRVDDAKDLGTGVCWANALVALSANSRQFLSQADNSPLKVIRRIIGFRAHCGPLQAVLPQPIIFYL